MQSARAHILPCIFVLYCVFSAPFVRAELLWPIDRPRQITGTFCESRGTRFHYGIDISCAGKKGFPIYAVDDGHVSTVIYEKWGIGYAVFVTHRNGLKSFYGHMDRFAPDVLRNTRVTAYEKNILDRKDFRVDLGEKDLAVTRGMILGYSGDSGIGKEHFHFELRNGDNVNLNPLKYGISVPDVSPPVFSEVRMAPLDGYAAVDGGIDEVSYNVQADNNKGPYRLSGGAVPRIAGRVGVKVVVYDRAGYTSRVAPYKIELHVNNAKTYEIVFDTSSRADARRMGLVYDYNETSGSRYTYYLYSRISGGGLLDTANISGNIPITIVAYDASGNTSVLSMQIRAERPLDTPAYVLTPNLKVGRKLRLNSSDSACMVEFDTRAALYDESITLAQYAPFPSPMQGLSVVSNVYDVAPSNLCTMTPANISIACNENSREKVGMYSLDRKSNTFFFVGNMYNARKKAFNARVFKMGGFFLLKDEIPPVIHSKAAVKARRGNGIKIKVSDIGHGLDLDAVTLRVDGVDVVWYYDFDYGYIEILPHNAIWQKGRHAITLQVVDLAGNKSEVKTIEYSI